MAQLEDNLNVPFGASSFWQAFQEVVLCVTGVITKDVNIFLARLSVCCMFSDTELHSLSLVVPCLEQKSYFYRNIVAFSPKTFWQPVEN